MSDTPSPEVLASLIESIRIHHIDHADSFDADDAKLVGALPARNYILNEMDDSQRAVLYRSVKHLWKRMSGSEPDLSISNKEAELLDGAYWLLPSGVIIKAFNHFQAVNENRLLFCSLLDINPLVVERMLASGDVNEVIGLTISRGGVRMLVDSEHQSVIMQTTEASWPWAKAKLERMYHKNRKAKIIDLKQPYEGWKSGVTVDVKSANV